MIAHEFGHTLGFTHASYLVPMLRERAWEADPLVPGFLDETGDRWDPMGRGPLPEGHYSAFFKTKAGWLEPVRGDCRRGGLSRGDPARVGHPGGVVVLRISGASGRQPVRRIIRGT